MKTILIMLSLLSLDSCKNDLDERVSYMDISVIRDITDPHVLQPNANSILALYNLSENKSADVNFRYCEILDKVLVPAVDLHLPDEAVTNRQNKKNEPLYRERIILNFYDTIRKTLSPSYINSDSSFKDYSECYKTISGELSLLFQSKSSNRVLLIFSNLFENSEILNIYIEKTKNLLLQKPGKIAEQFEKYNLLPERLNGIKVFFVFQPITRAEDLLYLQIVSEYRRLLESRGAIVKVQANNSY